MTRNTPHVPPAEGVPSEVHLFKNRCKDPKCPYFNPGTFHMHLAIDEPNVVYINAPGNNDTPTADAQA